MRRLSILLLIAVIVLLPACGRSALTPHPQTATPVPELNITRVPTMPSPTVLPPSETSVPTNTLEPSDTPLPTIKPTASPSPTIVRPSRTPITLSPPSTPAAFGPLRVNVYVSNCRLASTPDKPGNVIVQISIEATGGNGVYRYFNQGVESTSKLADILWERGTQLIGTVKVISGDGQTVEKVYNIVTGELDCG